MGGSGQILALAKEIPVGGDTNLREKYKFMPLPEIDH
jgi:hypothetical protein